MAVSGTFQHRPGGQIDVLLPSGWRRWGENIASASNLALAQTSLEDSPGHYANMVSPAYTDVGIGIAREGSRVYVTQNFGG